MSKPKRIFVYRCDACAALFIPPALYFEDKKGPRLHEIQTPCREDHCLGKGVFIAVYVPEGSV